MATKMGVTVKRLVGFFSGDVKQVGVRARHGHTVCGWVEVLEVQVAGERAGGREEELGQGLHRARDPKVDLEDNLGRLEGEKHLHILEGEG